MTFTPAPEFYYLTQGYFRQDFSELYSDLDELIEDIVLGFDRYGSKAALKIALLEINARLSDEELITLWRNSHAQIYFLHGNELRELFKMIAAAL